MAERASWFPNHAQLHTCICQCNAWGFGLVHQNQSEPVSTNKYQPRYDFVQESDCLDDYLHHNEEAHPVADYHPNDNAMLLHTRLGHASKKVMIECLKHGINMGVKITMNELIHSNIYCKACATSHINRKPFPK